MTTHLIVMLPFVSGLSLGVIIILAMALLASMYSDEVKLANKRADLADERAQKNLNDKLLDAEIGIETAQYRENASEDAVRDAKTRESKARASIEASESRISQIRASEEEKNQTSAA